MKRTLRVLGLGLALLLGAAACAAPRTGAAAAGPKPTGARLTSAPLGAALVTPAFGWVLTSNDLLLTGDGGTSFRPAKLNLPTGPARAAYFADARHGWVAAAAGSTITVARTVNGGATWQSTAIAGSVPVGRISVSFGDDRRGALLAGMQTSSNFSMGTIYATADGGRAWTASRAPIAGSVTVDSAGTIWLAGGVFGNQLFGSSTAGRTWAAQTLRVASGSVESVTAPAHGVVTATVTTGAGARMSLLTRSTSATWTETSTVRLAADPGVAAPAAGYGSTVLMIDPAGRHIYRGAGATADRQLSTVTSTSLPAGAMQASFVNADTGWVLSSYGQCRAAKTDCTYTTQVLATGDSGASWHPIATYR